MSTLAPAVVSGTRISSIQTLRGIAAMLVVVVHALAFSDFLGSAGLNSVRYLGAIGVDIFFVISGFVMALSVQNRRGPRAAGDFLVLRWARVAPPYIVVSVFMIAFLAAHDSLGPGPKKSLANVFLFIPWFDSTGFSRTPLDVGWTLSLEFTFYLFVAVAVLLRIKAAYLIVIIVAVVVAGRLVPEPSFLVSWFTNPIFLEFAAGIAAYALWRSGALRRTPWLWRTLGILGAVAVVIGCLVGYGEMGFLERTLDGTMSLQRVLWWGIPAALIFTAVVGGLPELGGPIGHVGSKLGNASYSIYLVHFPTMLLAKPFIGMLPQGLAFVVLIVGGTAVGMGFYRWAELPLTRLARRAADRVLHVGAPSPHP